MGSNIAVRKTTSADSWPNVGYLWQPLMNGGVGKQ